MIAKYTTDVHHYSDNDKNNKLSKSGYYIYIIFKQTFDALLK